MQASLAFLDDPLSVCPGNRQLRSLKPLLGWGRRFEAVGKRLRDGIADDVLVLRPEKPAKAIGVHNVLVGHI